ncbi:MAG: AbrB/MazE/SpoVT family DNA-binding domain-containing protein [Xanthomonadales bacterium]|nr:AbrB/MazE/SpoVT family DNA-binding domain-containing protein [Xanthomonadales bacterium]
MATAKLFKLGNSQAVRIPAQYRIDATEVEFVKQGAGLFMRPKTRTAADLFGAARAKGGDFSDWVRPDQGKVESVPKWD